MKHLLQQCLEALEIGRDSAYAEAQDYHQKYEGYRPLRHKALDDDVAKIESAITALKEALAKGEQIRNFVNSQEPLGQDFSKVLHDNRWDMYVSSETKPKNEQAPVACWCHKCNQNVFVHGIPFSCTRMIVCPDCGNKRCPKASDHTLQCMGSNEPEQAPVAWGIPNTAITGKSHALMVVRLEIPSDDQYAGKLWIPLYTRPLQRQPLSEEEIDDLRESKGTELYFVSLSEFTTIFRIAENAVYEKLGIK